MSDVDMALLAAAWDALEFRPPVLCRLRWRVYRAWRLFCFVLWAIGLCDVPPSRHWIAVTVGVPEDSRRAMLRRAYQPCPTAST